MLQLNKKEVLKLKIKQNLFPFFEKAGTRIQYHPQDIIYMQGDHAGCLYLIIQGRVSVYMLTPRGEEVTLEVLEKGHIFGESSFIQNSPRPTTVSAIDNVELIACQLDQLYPYLNESKELTISLLQYMSQRCDYLSSLVKKAYTYNRFEKVASFLLEQTSTPSCHNTITYSHEEIASLIGLSRVTVTNILNDFAKKKFITLHYKKIIIIQKAELAKLLRLSK